MPKEWENTITRYHIVEENLVGCTREQIKNYNLLTAVLVGLGKPDGENYAGVLKMLEHCSPERTSSPKRNGYWSRILIFP